MQSLLRNTPSSHLSSPPNGREMVKPSLTTSVSIARLTRGMRSVIDYLLSAGAQRNASQRASAVKRWLPKLLLGAATIVAIMWFSTREEATSPRKITNAQRQPEHPTHVSDQVRDVAAEARVAPVVAAMNRDDHPRMVKVEDLRNCGRATPADAFQTLIWAAFTGHDDEVAATIVLAEGDREIVKAWRAALPDEAQSHYPVIEKLPGIFLSAELLRRATAVQIGDAIESAPGETQVSVRIIQVDGTDFYLDAKMKYGNRGWGWEIPSKLISKWRKGHLDDAFAEIE